MPVARVENQPTGSGDHAGEQGAGEEGDGHRLAEVDEDERAAVGAEAEVGGVAEGHHARVAHDEVERQREEAEDEEIGEDRELVAGEHPRQRPRATSTRDERRGAPRRLIPPRRRGPTGRKMRMAPITAYMITMAVSGR